MLFTFKANILLFEAFSGLKNGFSIFDQDRQKKDISKPEMIRPYIALFIKSKYLSTPLVCTILYLHQMKDHEITSHLQNKFNVEEKLLV